MLKNTYRRGGNPNSVRISTLTYTETHFKREMVTIDIFTYIQAELRRTYRHPLQTHNAYE